jgi:hypothetical protein
MKLPAALKRNVDDWLAKGYSVEVVLTSPHTIRVTPSVASAVDPFDLVEMRR